MIKLYGLKQAMNFAEGEWIEETAARSGAETEQQRIMMIIEEGLTFLQAWLAKVPRTLDQGDAVGMMIGMRAHQKYNLSPEIVLGTLISQADEETIASALKYGRAAREDEKPKNFLRLVHSSSPGNPE
jgi:hypothetical protein